MDAAAAKLSGKASRIRKKGLKPKTHHFFWLLVVVCGWLAPPLAVAVRFGLGRDFFINLICTICGYFPGHFHNFYCQSIRNNRNAARTPKWAVKYGLVNVKDKRGGKHQWAGRYDERLPDSSRNDYADADSVDSRQEAAAEWDGRGPEPATRPNRQGNNAGGGGGKKHHGGFHITSPWDDVVEEEEVQGNPRRPQDADDSRRTTTAKPYDPLDNEEFFPSTSGADSIPTSSSAPMGGGRTSKLKARGFLGKNRSRYEDTTTSSSSGGGGGGGGGKGDRFDRMNAARASNRPTSRSDRVTADDYQDDFEREINGGASRSKPSNHSSSQATSRFDTFDNEGTENAWANSSVGAGSNSRSTKGPTSSSAGKSGDGDLFNHTF